MSAPLFSSRLSRPRSAARSGFTLIELLVAITVIGILVALLLPAVQAVQRNAWEASVSMDLAQLDAAVDKFKTDFGHYPSDFSEFVDANGDPLGWNDTIPAPFNVTVAQRWQQILTKISTNHNEFAFDDPGDATRPRIQIWWETVGVNLAVNAAGPATKEARLRGPQVALWFWMSQVFNDAQYPITGPRSDTVAPGYYVLAGNTEQKKFFDFGDVEVIQDVEYPADGDASTTYQITRALQRRGDAPMLYFHHQTYLDPYTAVGSNISTYIDFEPTAPATDPPNLGIACRVPNSSSAAGDPALFLQDSKYQIVTAGSDESFGNVEDSTVYENLDNLCSFSEGRLDAYVDEYVENN